jgi:hypothetical protein
MHDKQTVAPNQDKCSGQMLLLAVAFVLLAASGDALLTRSLARQTTRVAVSSPYKAATFGSQTQQISTRMSVKSTEKVGNQPATGGLRFGALFRKFLLAVMAFGALGVSRARAAGGSVKAVAAAISKNIYGWDSVGRVPYDDFLFSTRALTDPNLLKRTIVEEVIDNTSGGRGAVFTLQSGLDLFAATY